MGPERVGEDDKLHLIFSVLHNRHFVDFLVQYGYNDGAVDGFIACLRIIYERGEMHFCISP